MQAETLALAQPNRVARLLARLQERGLLATLRKAFTDKVFRASTSVIVEYRAGWGVAGKGNVHPDWLTFAVVRDRADLPPLCDWMAHRLGDFVAMLDAGKLAIFALQDGVVHGCVWVSLTDHHDPVSREFYAVGPHEAYHYCWMVDPSVRRTNIGMPLCRVVMTTLADLGIQRQFGVVDRVNRASYIIQTRFGYRERGVKVMHYVIFGSRWTRTARYQGTLGTVTPPRRA